jgi:hypothetical protein
MTPWTSNLSCPCSRSDRKACPRSLISADKPCPFHGRPKGWPIGLQVNPHVRCWMNSGKHLLALGFSGFDPSVWTGRALQAECEKMEGFGLAHLYPALAWSVCAPGHHGYPRAPDLILGKALRGRLGHQITGTTARPFLHLLHSTRRPRQVALHSLVTPGISLGHPLRLA